MRFSHLVREVKYNVMKLQIQSTTYMIKNAYVVWWFREVDLRMVFVLERWFFEMTWMCLLYRRKEQELVIARGGLKVSSP